LYFILFTVSNVSIHHYKLINCLTYYRHIPKAKHTTVAETPELKRIAENTRLQSNVSASNIFNLSTMFQSLYYENNYFMPSLWIDNLL